MKRYIRDHWAALLESGKYRQAVGRLCIVDTLGYRFCCLGILVEMHQSAHREETGEALYTDHYNIRHALLFQEKYGGLIFRGE